MNQELNARLKQYKQAEKAILEGGQSYRIGNRTLTRANLAEVQDMITKLYAQGARDEDMPAAMPKRAKRIVFNE